MNKIITDKNEMRESIREGMAEIAGIVATTLGPGGLPVIIERMGQALNGDALGPMITKDGVSVAVECASDNPQKDVIIQAVKAICQKTNRVAGDGTTTAIVLGNALFNSAIDAMKDSKVNPQIVRRAMETIAKSVDDALVSLAVPCTDLGMIEQVARVSANGDDTIGKIIREAFGAVGSEGVITVDEGAGANHTLEIVDGFQFRRGAEAQDRFFNNTERTKFEVEGAHVILYDGKMQSASDVAPILNNIYTDSKSKGESMPPVVFIASEFSQEVIQMLLIFKAEQGLSVCAVRAPHQTSVSTQILEDISYFLGGTKLGNGGRNLANIEFDDIGICERFIADKYTCTMFGGMGEDSDVQDRIGQLKAQRESAESPYDAALLSDRIASLAQGIAKIGVGGLTELETKETYHRIEDAVNASRAAIEEGIVAGGGTTLFRIAESLESSKNQDNSLGVSIVSEALRAPMDQIMDNLGIDMMDKSKISDEILKDPSSVFDGRGGGFKDYLEAGIIDPVKVTRTAFANAISIAALLATCGGAITYDRSK